VRSSGREAKHPVRVKLADDKEWSRVGQLDFVDNQLNPKSGTLRGRAIFENKDQLFTPGLFARMQLYGGEFDALLIPDGAIVSDQARKVVFVVGADNVVKAQPVSLGGIVDGLRVVKTGLKAEDQVVIDGLANPMVRPGAKIVPQAGQIKAAAN
jgi:membrane fusion protein, multidrug efflux system